MIRKIIEIDEEKCNGCGACANACHEGAIAMVNGKAKLIRDDYCDGMGDCLPECPTGAIRFTEREAAAYDAAAVAARQKKKTAAGGGAGDFAAGDFAVGDFATGGGAHGGFHGCPGHRLRQFRREEPGDTVGATTRTPISRLGQWPCQIRLVPVNAPYFDGANLLIAADCTAFAYAGLHEELMRGKITLIGCPKLDAVDYSEKLTEIIRNNDIRSVTVVRMEVPCCGGLQQAAINALKTSGKFIPWQVVTVSVDGHLLNN